MKLHWNEEYRGYIYNDENKIYRSAYSNKVNQWFEFNIMFKAKYDKQYKKWNLYIYFEKPCNIKIKPIKCDNVKECKYLSEKFLDNLRKNFQKSSKNIELLWYNKGDNEYESCLRKNIDENISIEIKFTITEENEKYKMYVKCSMSEDTIMFYYIPCYTTNIGKEIAKYKTEKLFNDIINSLK